MAVEVLHDARVEINSVDHSDHVTSVSLPMSTAEIDAKAMGDVTMIKAPGLLDFSLEVGFNDEFTSGGFDQLMFAIWSARSSVDIKVRKDSGSVSATNPSYEFEGFVSGFSPAAEHGAKVAGTLSLSCTTDLSRVVV